MNQRKHPAEYDKHGLLCANRMHRNKILPKSIKVVCVTQTSKEPLDNTTDRK